MKKILITGNPESGLARSLAGVFPLADFVSRATGDNLSDPDVRERIAQRALDYDVFINNSALWRFEQTLILESVWKAAETAGKTLHIVCVGSTTDRAAKGSSWIYQQEKKALRSYCNQLALQSVWKERAVPRVSLVSLGTLHNNQEKHPNRRVMHTDDAASYIKWIVEAPTNVNINELSVDPIQRK